MLCVIKQTCETYFVSNYNNTYSFSLRLYYLLNQLLDNQQIDDAKCSYKPLEWRGFFFLKYFLSSAKDKENIELHIKQSIGCHILSL